MAEAIRRWRFGSRPTLRFGTTIRRRGTAISPNVANRVPDVINYAWREYGMRVGLWRVADVLDAAGIKASVALNSAVCETFPKAMDEMKKRGWEFMGHGTTNSENLAGLAPEKEKEVIQHVLKTIEQSTGKRPRGWLGTGLVRDLQHARHPRRGRRDLLRRLEQRRPALSDESQEGQDDLHSLLHGDQRYARCSSRKNYTGEQYYRSVIDQFDALYADSSKALRASWAFRYTRCSSASRSESNTCSRRSPT